MHYYNFNIGDYRRQTGHLTLLEHAIYKNLLDTYYLSEQPLCADIAKLMRSQSVRTADERIALENVLSDFFELAEDGYRNKTCDEVIAKYHLKSDKARKSAKKRWEGNANALEPQSKGNANHKPITNNQLKDMSSVDDCEPDYSKILANKVIDMYNTVKATQEPNWTAVDARTKSRMTLASQRIKDVQKRIGSKDNGKTLKWFTDFLVALSDEPFYSGKPNYKNPAGYKWKFDSLFKEKNFVDAYERLNEQ